MINGLLTFFAKPLLPNNYESIFLWNNFLHHLGLCKIILSKKSSKRNPVHKACVCWFWPFKNPVSSSFDVLNWKFLSSWKVLLQNVNSKASFRLLSNKTWPKMALHFCNLDMMQHFLLLWTINIIQMQTFCCWHVHWIGRYHIECVVHSSNSTS